MKTSHAFGLAGLGLCLAAPALHAQEVGRVISSVPVIQQVAVPRQVCTQQPVTVEQPKSGAGALLGAVAGGAAGNAIGSGGGRALATMAGVLGGAVLGNSIEGPNTQVQQASQCSTQTYYENRAIGYNVTYEYAGKQYQVQLPQDPGPTIHLQVVPVGAGPAAPVAPAPAPVGVPAPQTFVAPPAVQPSVVTRDAVVVPGPVVMAAPVYAYPAPYYRPYYWGAPSVSFSLGYVHHGGHRR